MRRSRIAVLTAASALFASSALAAGANAAFHDIRVSELHEGPGVTDDVVELQMFSNGQNFLLNHHLRIYTAAGAVNGDYPVPADAPNGQTQRTFTIGNSAAQDYNYGGTVLDPAGGAVCWNESGAAPFGGQDCVSWGSYTTGVEALSSPAGANAPAFADGQSLHRSISRGCATLLEAADDTNNSAADFTVGAPSLRNNTVAPTEKPCTPAGKKKKCKKKKKKKSGSGKLPYAAKKKCKKKKKKK